MSDRQSVELVWMLVITLLCFAFAPAAGEDDTKPDRCVCVCLCVCVCVCVHGWTCFVKVNAKRDG